MNILALLSLLFSFENLIYYSKEWRTFHYFTYAVIFILSLVPVSVSACEFFTSKRSKIKRLKFAFYSYLYTDDLDRQLKRLLMKGENFYCNEFLNGKVVCEHEKHYTFDGEEDVVFEYKEGTPKIYLNFYDDLSCSLRNGLIERGFYETNYSTDGGHSNWAGFSRESFMSIIPLISEVKFSIINDFKMEGMNIVFYYYFHDGSLRFEKFSPLCGIGKEYSYENVSVENFFYTINFLDNARHFGRSCCFVSKGESMKGKATDEILHFIRMEEIFSRTLSGEKLKWSKKRKGSRFVEGENKQMMFLKFDRAGEVILNYIKSLGYSDLLVTELCAFLVKFEGSRRPRNSPIKNWQWKRLMSDVSYLREKSNLIPMIGARCVNPTTRVINYYKRLKEKPQCHENTIVRFLTIFTKDSPLTTNKSYMEMSSGEREFEKEKKKNVSLLKRIEKDKQIFNEELKSIGYRYESEEKVLSNKKRIYKKERQNKMYLISNLKTYREVLVSKKTGVYFDSFDRNDTGLMQEEAREKLKERVYKIFSENRFREKMEELGPSNTKGAEQNCELVNIRSPEGKDIIKGRRKFIKKDLKAKIGSVNIALSGSIYTMINDHDYKEQVDKCSEVIRGSTGNKVLIQPRPNRGVAKNQIKVEDKGDNSVECKKRKKKGGGGKRPVDVVQKVMKKASSYLTRKAASMKKIEIKERKEMEEMKRVKEEEEIKRKKEKEEEEKREKGEMKEGRKPVSVTDEVAPTIKGPNIKIPDRIIEESLVDGYKNVKAVTDYITRPKGKVRIGIQGEDKEARRSRKADKKIEKREEKKRRNREMVRMEFDQLRNKYYYHFLGETD